MVFPTTIAANLAVYLESADLVDATTAAPARASTHVSETYRSSHAAFLGDGQYNTYGQCAGAYVGTSKAPAMVVGPPHPEDDVLAELVTYRQVNSGWDGEAAAKPVRQAIDQAIAFVRLGGDAAHRLLPTLDVDGSVLLEIGESHDGVLKFRGDNKIIYSLEGVRPSVVDFDGLSIPVEIRQAISS